jgi:hypothetical protein
LKRTGYNADDVVASGFGFSRNYKPFFDQLKKSGFQELSQDQMTEEVFKRKLTNHIVGLSSHSGKATTVSTPLTKEGIESSFKFIGTQAQDIGVSTSSVTKREFLESIQKVLPKVFGADDIAKIAGNEITDEIIEKGVGAVAKKFAGGMAAKGLFAKTAMAVTGVGMGFSLPLFAATVGLGVLASSARQRQENSVNNYVNSRLWSGSDMTDKVSEAAYSSINVHGQTAYSNDMDYNYILNTANNSKKIVDSYDPTPGVKLPSEKDAFEMY